MIVDTVAPPVSIEIPAKTTLTHDALQEFLHELSREYVGKVFELYLKIGNWASHKKSPFLLKEYLTLPSGFNMCIQSQQKGADVQVRSYLLRHTVEYARTPNGLYLVRGVDPNPATCREESFWMFKN